MLVSVRSVSAAGLALAAWLGGACAPWLGVAYAPWLGVAYATSVAPLTLDEAAAEAEVVVRARVAKASSTWGLHLGRRAIVTEVVLDREEPLRGAPVGHLTLFGGAVGDHVMRLEGQPSLSTGDEVLLLLAGVGARACPFVGVWQGVYHLREGRVWREGRPVVDVVRGEVLLGRDGERPMREGDFLACLEAALARAAAHAPAKTAAEQAPTPRPEEAR